MSLLSSLALALVATVSTAGPSAYSMPSVGSTTYPVHGTVELTFTSMTQDPTTGLIQVTGDAVANGTYGVLTGTDTYDIDPLTGAFVGMGTRVGPDGSTFTAFYQGQFINATDSVGTYTIPNGTGRFANIVGAGTFASSRWANGLGSSSIVEGTATRSR